MVHQHFMLVENFTVLENIILGFEGELVFGKKLEQAKKNLLSLCETYKLNIDLDSTISDLSVGFRQRVEILKSIVNDLDKIPISSNSTPLILDSGIFATPPL